MKNELPEKTVVGEGKPILPKLSTEAKEASTMHGRIEDAKRLLQLGLSTSSLLDARREAYFRDALSLLSNIATE